MKRFSVFIILFAGIILLLVANLLIGTVDIPVKDVCGILLGDDSNEIWTNIIFSSRLPQALTAIVAGAGLAVSGLQMQTVFRNPLAGPSVLGISNGSALGVAFVVLLSGRIGGVALSRLGYLGDAAMSVAAIIGALAVLMLILWVSQKVRGSVTLLVIGVMIGYLANAIIGVLKFLSPEEDVKAFVVWGLGSFSRVSGDEMVLFVVLMCILLPLTSLLVKPMNLLLLGDRNAANLGLNIRRARMLVIISSGVLVAIVTAYCGPIMFLGLAVPHLARAFFRTSDHRILLPATALRCSATSLPVCLASKALCPSTASRHSLARPLSRWCSSAVARAKRYRILPRYDVITKCRYDEKTYPSSSMSRMVSFPSGRSGAQ